MLEEMFSSAIGPAAAAGVYTLLTVLLAASWRRRSQGVPLLVASGLSALWTGLTAAAALAPALPEAAVTLAELARTGAWLAVLLIALRQLVPDAARQPLWRDPLALAGTGLLALGAAGALAGRPAVPGLPDAAAAIAPGLMAGLGLAVLGLVLVENLFRATPSRARWTFKHLLIGLGGLFAYDLFLYSEALLFRQVSWATAAARPLVSIMIVPFLLVAAARIRIYSFDVTISREAVLHTTALVGAGLYLLGIAGFGWLLRETGMSWGPLLQMLFLAAALLLLAVLLLSGQVQARLRGLIARHFFSFAYDYRREWLRFIRTMAASNEAGDDAGSLAGSLDQRAIRALSDVFECGAGALFLRGRGDIYALAARLGWGDAAGLLALPEALVALMEGEPAVVELRGRHAAAGATAAEAVRTWLDGLDAPWLLVPLRARDRIVGAVLLGQPRAPRALTWEDRDLLHILGIQIGSLIAGQQAATALIEAQRFEKLSRSFSFVAHDLKNLVSQLSLILRQAERHGGNPEFQRDALATIGDSVEKMRGMLVRLRETALAEPERRPVDLPALLRDLLARRGALLGNVRLRLPEGGDNLGVDLDPAGLAAAIGNLVQNAIEAAGPAGRVEIVCRSETGRAVVEITDNGPGMTQEFIRDRLFQPFASTKGGGFGIGMVQTRTLIERCGGRLEIDSEVGRGTTARVLLPLSLRPQPAAIETLAE